MHLSIRTSKASLSPAPLLIHEVDHWYAVPMVIFVDRGWEEET